MFRKINSLKGRTVVITGASSGAGRAAALAFASHGTALVLAGRNEKALTEIAEECTKLGARAKFVVTDVKDTAAMANLALEAKNWNDSLDVWINNAGVLAAGTFDETPMAVHQQVILTNLFGYMNGAHAVLPIFKEQERGILINNISIGGFLPVPYGGGYTASKFGLRGFFEALKGELIAWPHIHICDLFPAFLDTPGIQHAANYTGRVLKPAPPVYDPALVARAMVRVALRPRSSTYIGGASIPLKTAHALCPGFTTRTTGRVIHKYLKIADPIPHTDGNLFNTVDFGMSTNGNSIHRARPGRKLIAAGVLTGLAVGVFFLGRKNL
ncbi:MAG TPA: SDR family oxidoreductase [Puia sp.]|nr:SDR family oxidoreductase [Puia sp.]